MGGIARGERGECIELAEMFCISASLYALMLDRYYFEIC